MINIDTRLSTPKVKYIMRDVINVDVFYKVKFIMAIILISSFPASATLGKTEVSIKPQLISSESIPQLEITSEKNHSEQYAVKGLDESLRQQHRLDHLEDKVESITSSSGMNFAVWTGILLASVAIILTSLGVVMALFSFLGYKKIMNSARDISTTISEKISRDVAKEVAENLAPEVTENVLIKLLDEKKFDIIINEAVEKIIYRGVQFKDSDLLEGEEK
jgi:hypothetical protein